MDDIFTTLIFMLFALVAIMARVLIPIALIIVGSVLLKKKHKTVGKIILIIGIVYFSLSLGHFIYSGIVYGW